jgi:predicted short-subunit dehydrogenase-like oxidoreductase (DUF2520 family)
MKIAIAGYGNAAWHFVKMMRKAGHHIVGAWGRNESRLASFCASHGLRALSSPGELPCDLIILAVSDDAVASVSAMVPEGPLTVHVSGSLPLDAIAVSNRGVIWPMQSLTTGHSIDYANVPFCVEAAMPETEAVLQQLLEPLGSPVHTAKGPGRMKLHLAAVFACNFSNHLYRVAEHLTKGTGVPFEMLHPLILQTARKIQIMPPAMAQTGPARRKDTRTIMRHTEMLRDEPELANLYRIFTQLIQDKSNEQQL